MYQRKFYPDEGTIKIPENYSGIAMEEPSESTYIESIPKAAEEDTSEPDEGFSDAATRTGAGCNPWEAEEKTELPSAHVEASASEKTGLFGSKANSVWSRALAIGEKFGLGIPSFGLEELLLIGAAILLFFSQNGDKECALMLLALLFIKQ